MLFAPVHISSLGSAPACVVMVNEGLRSSRVGLAAIAEFEGFEPRLYDCIAGHCTIGFGHLVHRGKTGSDPEAEAPFAGGIQREDALQLLRGDVSLAEQAIERHVTVRLQQPEFDALVSFVFNLGEGAFKGSTLLRLLNQGQFRAASQQFDRWVMAGDRMVDGLVRRRAKERAMFERGRIG